MSMTIDIILFAVGLVAFLITFLPFSPMTIDLVNLRRETQITIYRHRHKYWLVGAITLGLLLVRGIGAMTAEPGASGLLYATSPAWFWIALVTAALLAFMFWSGYVPFVMTPPSNPQVLTVDEADRYLKPEDVVLGFEYGGEVRAYPRDSIARPHYFNDRVGGEDFTISYCILCNSGIAFKSEIDGRPIQLRCVTAYNNNIIYYESETGNFIQQLDGKVIEGPDTGKALNAYPVTQTSWREWKTLHPETRLYYAPPASLRDRMVGLMLQVLIPVHKLAKRKTPWHRIRGTLDTRLPAMSFVFGVELNEDACAYALDTLRQNPVINDTVGGEPVAIFYEPEGDVGEVFLRNAGEHILSFRHSRQSDPVVVAEDNETGSHWSIHGEAVEGELKRQRLRKVPHYNKLFWFSWALFKPHTRIGPVEGVTGNSPQADEAARHVHS